MGVHTKKKMQGYGRNTIGELAMFDPRLLQEGFGKWGYILHYCSKGMETSPVAELGEEAVIKSVGNSTTTTRDLTCEEDVSTVFWMLAESVAERMREDGLMCRTVQISLRDTELHWFDRQMKLDVPTCLAAEIHKAGMKLFRANYSWERPLRSIGIRGAELVPDSTPQQISLLDDEEKREKLERIERTMDDISRRFGHYAIGRAITTFDNTLANINPKDDHTIHPVAYFKAV